jgi:phytoene synthase
MNAKPIVQDFSDSFDPFDPSFLPDQHASGKSHFQASFIFVWSRQRRQALSDLYAFCRIADDIADEEGLSIEARWRLINSLSRWLKDKKKINHPFWDRFLDECIKFEIPDSALQGILDGVSWDLTNMKLQIQTWDALNQYVYGVACCVGEAVLSILGAKGPESKAYSLNMGRCLQYLNIMRDIEEDTKAGRVYVPREFLKSLGPVKTEQIVRDEMFNRAMEFRSKAKPYSWRCLPAEVMAAIYIEASDIWWRFGVSHRLSKKEKLGIGLKTLLKFIFYPSSLVTRL